MENDLFMKVLNDLQHDETSLLSSKGDEYAGKIDRLQNFRDISKVLNISMSTVCGVFLLKQIFAIASYIYKNKKPTTESLYEKILDSRNYLTLLTAILIEENKIKEKENI